MICRKKCNCGFEQKDAHLNYKHIEQVSPLGTLDQYACISIGLINFERCVSIEAEYINLLSNQDKTSL
jgi:hypothetical protein